MMHLWMESLENGLHMEHVRNLADKELKQEHEHAHPPKMEEKHVVHHWLNQKLVRSLSVQLMESLGNGHLIVIVQDRAGKELKQRYERAHPHSMAEKHAIHH
jgi:hypothetical protein